MWTLPGALGTHVTVEDVNTASQGSYKKSFHNLQTFHKHLQHVYGAEKQHEGTQLFRTSSKGA